MKTKIIEVDVLQIGIQYLLNRKLKPKLKAKTHKTQSEIDSLGKGTPCLFKNKHYEKNINTPSEVDILGVGTRYLLEKKLYRNDLKTTPIKNSLPPIDWSLYVKYINY